MDSDSEYRRYHSQRNHRKSPEGRHEGLRRMALHDELSGYKGLTEKEARNDRTARLEGSHTRKEWRAMLAEYRYCCAKCGSTDKLGKDHIIPISRRESTNDISNIQPLCNYCNSIKGTKKEERTPPFHQKRG